MTTPATIADHVQQAKDLLTSMFAEREPGDRKVINGLLAAWVARVQELEDAIWEVINARGLNGTGIVLDILGQIVGEPRNGRTDDFFREAIRLRILINMCGGSEPELLRIVDVAAQGGPWEWFDAFPAGFRVLFGGTWYAARALKDAVQEAKVGGTEATVTYAPVLGNAFRFASSTGAGHAADARGFASSGAGAQTSVFTHLVPKG